MTEKDADSHDTWLEQTATDSEHVRVSPELIISYLSLKEEGEEPEWLLSLAQMTKDASDHLNTLITPEQDMGLAHQIIDIGYQNLRQEQEAITDKGVHSKSCYYNGCVNPDEHSKKELERT